MIGSGDGFCNKSGDLNDLVLHKDNKTSDACTITDVCNSDNLPEIEIVSLVEEQIPKYTLRADKLTEFGGYSNEDWINYPCYNPDEESEILTDEQIGASLDYFSVSGVRISQMTKTYSDIEAITRLLEEKERDLEIAARIGQSLLEKNREISDKNEILELDLSGAYDRVSQLRHEVAMKDDLLQIYVQDLENGSETPSPNNPTRGFNLTLANLDGLQKKLKVVEIENFELRSKHAELQIETVTLEEKEQQLVKDCVHHLEESNKEVRNLTDDLNQKTDRYIKQQEEITCLLTKVVDLECKVKQVTIENADLHGHLQAAVDSQRELTTEILELHDKYNECMELLQEANEEIKRLRNKNQPKAMRHYSYSPFAPKDSLASELEDTMRKNMPWDSDYTVPSPNDAYKVMETAKFIKKASKKNPQPVKIPGSSPADTSGHETGGESCLPSNRSSMFFSENMSETESIMSEGYQGDNESLYSAISGSPSKSYTSSQLGSRLSIPGSNDLETAIHRLNLRRQQGIDERRLNDENDDTVESTFLTTEGSNTPTSCWTPDSFLSSTSGLSCFSGRSSQYKLPEKLRIVKPLEGSVTLHHWKRLATPNFGGLLEDRPGVQIKGESKIEKPVEEDYKFSDFEEDEPSDNTNAAKAIEMTSFNYTLTNSTVKHPRQYTPAACTTTMSTSSGGCRPGVIKLRSQIQPPTDLNYGTSTFSMNTGLAELLDERDIQDQINPEEPVISTNPQRSSSIVTETLFNPKLRSISSGAIYTAPASSTTSTFTQSLGLGSKTECLNSMQAFASTLTDKIQNLGFHRFIRGESPEEIDIFKEDRLLESAASKVASPTFTPPNSPTLSTACPSPTTPPNSPILQGPTRSHSAFSFDFTKPSIMLQLAGMQGRGPPVLGSLLGRRGLPTIRPGLFEKP